MSGPTIAYDLPNKEYHDDKLHYSSTPLKKMVEDAEIFHHDVVLGQGKKISGSALDIGTYFHTAILEPHKLDIECAVWKGFRKGKDWEAFAVANAHKAIITDGAELSKATSCIEGVKNSPIAMSYLRRGHPEVSAFLQVHVYRGRIYYFTTVAGKGFNARYLSEDGWKPTNLSPKAKTIELGLKVRADSICMDDDEADLFILDLKSASGDVKNVFDIQSKISSLNYDLSAALYLDVFSAARNKTYKKFIWTFASKDAPICKNYVASPKSVKVGRAKWAFAVIEIAKYKARNWKFEDEMAEIGPKEFELEWISKGLFPDELGPELVIEKEILQPTTKQTIIEEDLL